jgi:spermidine synthase
MTVSETHSNRSQQLLLPELAVFLASAAVIGLELALMRCLNVAAWHHFSYLIISTALLGFGASGTLLTLFGPALERRFETWCAILTLAFALATPLCFRAAQALPLDPQFSLYSARQAAMLLLYPLCLFVPFLLGAMVIGLALMHLSKHVHGIYGANLVGSGLGGLCITLLMFILPEVKLLHAVVGLIFIAAFLWVACNSRSQHGFMRPTNRKLGRINLRRRPAFPLLLAAAFAAGILLSVEIFSPLSLRIDPYKMLAVVQRWEAQSDATHLLTLHSPRGRLDVYDSPLFHETLFAGFTASSPPPSQLRILVDGNALGTVFKIEDASQAAILDHTLMSVPYRIRERPRVLLLGETGGTNVWLARRFDAQNITVVQGNPQIIQLLTGALSEESGGVLSRPDVTAVATEPRLFLESGATTYDIIQLVHAEGMSVGVSSLLSVNEDYLLTREGLALCLKHLNPGGVLAITRQQQDPPRDNVKVLVTLTEALESLNVEIPSDHIIQFRNYLAVTTLASRTPISTDVCERVLSICRELRLDVEWAPCPGVSYEDQIARVSGPPGESYSYYHYAAQEIFSPRREAFLKDWVYRVDAPTDDSPYFYNFFKWGSIPLFQSVYGSNWFRKLELGYVVVAGVLVELTIVGVLLILLPLLWLKQPKGKKKGRLPTGLYFLLLGLAYMLLEMVFIMKFTRFLGDPILAASGVVSAFLVFSGLGSLASRRFFPRSPRAIAIAAIGIVSLAVCYTFTLDGVFELGAGWPTSIRMFVTILLVGPLSFLMGWPFPNGLACIERKRPTLIPWAWGVNGVASVIGPPVGVLLAVASGFRSVILLAALLYGSAGLIAWTLPGAKPKFGRGTAH